LADVRIQLGLSSNLLDADAGAAAEYRQYAEVRLKRLTSGYLGLGLVSMLTGWPVRGSRMVDTSFPLF
jgi:hypothetical protein